MCLLAHRLVTSYAEEIEGVGGGGGGGGDGEAMWLTFMSLHVYLLEGSYHFCAYCVVCVLCGMFSSFWFPSALSLVSFSLYAINMFFHACIL